MKLRTFTYLGVAGLAAVLVYQLRQDARIEDAARDLRQVAEVVMTGGTMPGDLPAVLRGSARVVDGRTLQFLNPRVTVELAGIDVCDPDQWAYFDGTPWPCGAVSTAWLVSQTLGRTVECQTLDRRFDGTVIGRCGVDGADIAGEALAQGQAVINVDTRAGLPIETYRELQEKARQSRIGIWSSVFTPPAEWRKDRVNDLSTRVRRVDQPGLSKESETLPGGE